MSTISIKQMNYSYIGQDEPVFQQFDLTMDTAWKPALVARNGRGKTTLLKLISKELTPDSGHIQTVDCGYFPLPVTDKSLYPVALFDLELDELWQVEKELQRLDGDAELLWQPWQTLSGGERVKVMTAILFSQHHDYLLLDEPTIFLDEATKATLCRYLTQQKQGFLLVTHDQYFMDECVDHIVALEAHDTIVMQGHYTQYEEEREHRHKQVQKQNKKLERDMKRLEEAMKQSERWSNTKEKEKHGNPHEKNSKSHLDKGFLGARSARMMKKSKQLERRRTQSFEEKKALLSPIEDVEQLVMTPTFPHHKRLYDVTNLQLFYNDEPLFYPVSFEILPRDVVAIRGNNGTGKSSLLHYLVASFAGKASYDDERRINLKVSVLSQFFEEMGTLFQLAERYKVDTQTLIHNVRKLGLSRSKLDQTIETMSQGERQKMALALSLFVSADLYIWDEPLIYLDISCQKQVEEVVIQTHPTLVVVDHNRHFIEKIKTKDVILTPVR